MTTDPVMPADPPLVAWAKRTDADRKAAEHAYAITAFNYPEAPVGSRDWTLFWSGWQQARAAQPASEGAAQVPNTSFGLSDEQLSVLLRESLKPEEIVGAPTVQHDRVRELLHWFARYADGDANGKWLYGHAFELAHYVASNAINRAIDLRPIRDESFKEGCNITPADRDMLTRIGFLTAKPQEPGPQGAPKGGSPEPQAAQPVAPECWVCKGSGRLLNAYSAATPQAGAAPVALPIEQIVRIASMCDSDACDGSQTTAFARAIERAHGIVGAPDAERLTAVPVAADLLSRFERAVNTAASLHGQYMGKAMPDREYDIFTTARDESVPALRAQLRAALYATPLPAAAPVGEAREWTDAEIELMTENGEQWPDQWPDDLYSACRMIARMILDNPPGGGPEDWWRGYKECAGMVRRAVHREAERRAALTQQTAPAVPSVDALAVPADDFERFIAWARPFVWSHDKGAMDLAWMAFRAALAHLRATRQQAAPEQERPQFDPLPPGKSPRADPSLEWPGPGPEPAKWMAPNGTIVYRSYEDYCDD